MGRAGQGGYGTVQHAYDTRLKRDVAIKCIQITQADIARSRISIHDAQVENASRALTPKNRIRRQPSPSEMAAKQFDQTGGFKPLTAQIAEPTFFSMREKNAAKRARRHDFLKKNGNRSPQAEVDFEEVADDVDYGDNSIYLNDFTGYKNFKNGRKKGTGRKGSPVDVKQVGMAGNIPGMIAGAGQADIDAVGENSIALGMVYDSDNLGGINPWGAAPGGNTMDFKPLAGSAAERRMRAQSTNDFDDDFEDGPYPEGDKLANVSRIPGLEEARTAAHLNDANIVTVFDCVVEGNMAYVIMEYVEGKTLAKILRDMGNDITLDIIASVFTSVSHALEVAHKAGVLHLDIKPENVIINGDGVVKVTDFGLSTLMDASGQGSTGGGTIGYMPLEQMRQQRLDVRTDEWALASLTYEMLSGKNPFKARTLADAETAIIDAELVLPSLCWEDIDESVDDIIFGALSPTADGRYPDIESFASDLTPMLGSAKEGKAQLAKVASNALPTQEERNARAQTPHVPFIDRLGMRGSSIVMRVFSALGTAMLAVIALMNIRFGFGEGTGAVQVEQAAQTTTEATQYIQAGLDTTFGLFSMYPVVAWIILAAIIALSAIWPRFIMPASYGLFVVMLFFNQAWLPAFLLLLATGAWWWFYGRTSDMMCTLVVLQPLFGAFGFSAVVPVLAGALLDIKDALFTSLMIIVSAFAFASLGSADIMNWDILSNFIVAVDPSIAGAAITNGFVSAISSPYNWIVAASWVAAASVYSLLCRKGTHVFDIVGSVTAAALVIAGAVAFPIATEQNLLLNPNVISGAVTAAAIGVAFALLNVPDRVRMAPGEW